MKYSPPVISVLTPVYNGERYLAECIESVLAQTRTDWEYIIVDNCSQDGTADLAERYAARDERIRVRRCEEFVGVYSNFNRCVPLMSQHSRYCKFLSADDWMYPECLERMVSVAERHTAVGVVTSYHLYGKRVDHDGVIPYTDEVVPGPEAIRTKILENKYLIGSPSQLLYRADLVRRAAPFFDENVWHADGLATFGLLLEHDLGFVHQVLTYTRVHGEALTSRSLRLNTYLPGELQFLIAFGPKVLAPQVYRTAIRTSIRRYTWFLMKQRVKPSRFRDAEFHLYHREEIARLLAEAGEDRETSILLRSLRALI
jgi:glycosyltransferase involved in cell wall biosynthesis